MVKQREGETAVVHISELYSSQTLKYPFFRHASRSRLELGECLQAGCLQGGDEEFEHGGEVHSLNNLLREAEDGLVDAVNPFAELRGAWEKYTVAISLIYNML